jgi:putative ABC transport system permease protein
MFENIRVALVGLQSNKLRSALTMLGITIGVASVILLISLGQAVENFILGQFSNIGTNLIFVAGAPNEFDRPEPLTESDYRALSDTYRVPDALYIMPLSDVGHNINTDVIYEGQQASARVSGVTPIFTTIFNRRVIDGRFFDEAELAGSARVAVIGQTVIENLFEDVYPIGKTIQVNGVRLEVIGILNEQGGGGLGPGSDQDNWILTPLTTVQQRLDRERTINGEFPVSTVVIQARDQSRVDAVVQQVEQTLREEHNISFREEDDFAVLTQDELIESFGSITSLLTVFLGVIAGISLFVGGIGIMNIMLVTVTERTREIGLRKAVGAQNHDILLQFLTEATVLALVGGGIGTALAVGGMALIGSLSTDLAAGVQVSSILFATFISVLIGVFFGIYPASRAASLNPIDALRYE